MNHPDNLELRIIEQVEQIRAVADLLPGVVIIHRMPDLRVEYMSPNGLKLLDLTLEEVRALDSAKYHELYFNIDDARDYVPKIRELIDENSDETISFFQQVRFAKNKDWVWHMSSIKILMRDDVGLPLLAINIAIRIDPMNHITAKVSRMLEENNFLRNNYQQFSKLSKRECEILQLMALGQSAAEISGKLFISARTVETHRRNIKQKLNAGSLFELSQYARAFDLI